MHGSHRTGCEGSRARGLCAAASGARPLQAPGMNFRARAPRGTVPGHGVLVKHTHMPPVTTEEIGTPSRPISRKCQAFPRVP